MNKNPEIQVRKQIKKLIKETLGGDNELAHGNKEIEAMQKTLKSDEYIWLDDTTDLLTGQKVTKKEYVKRMLKSALETKKWEKVQNAILFLDSQL